MWAIGTIKTPKCSRERNCESKIYIDGDVLVIQNPT